MVSMLSMEGTRGSMVNHLLIQTGHRANQTIMHLIRIVSVEILGIIIDGTITCVGQKLFISVKVNEVIYTYKGKQ